MKSYYIKDIFDKMEVGQIVEILGWVASKRNMGKIVFLDLADSTGKIQATVSKGIDSNIFLKARELAPESSVRVEGVVKKLRKSKEIEVKVIELICDASPHVVPQPRSSFDIFDKKLVDLILTKRHLYLRNERLMAVLKFRHKLIEIFREWFRKEGFIEIHAPILTQLPLYDDDTLFSLDFFGERIFLTQCVAFYLESAVCAFEKVYNINPSFRAEKSRGKRYLAEFWHIKAEIAFADFNDIIAFTEGMISYVIRRIRAESKDELKILKVDIEESRLTKTPYPRITYDEALNSLKAMNTIKEWGKSLSDMDVSSLSKAFDTPFWVTGNPRRIEAFPYKIDPSNTQLTKTADLIATEGFGELLGVAEKIWQRNELLERMKEKGKDSDERYRWYLELRQFGSIPHSGFGMGIERLIRWLLRLGHVRDAIPFPRLFRRHPNP
ncbi:MAG: hypothetical protein COZ69_04385 [Deltaproteobacteria bacterium CG_4_8_14_3_um_filter_45_9]|nr:MAG: hypothetical protein COS40_15080 [Deltaproteobacteria bacterium CG03_land_8_20_14_0_80_45_14]PIX25102.1 MAG: hypothetical protein COZ69_04385 [Deltaproteobacteria bacterium CG_4_8_14_3_um_filter_45_9]